MEPPRGEYRFTRLENVIFGPGQIAQLGRELERRKLARAIVLTGQTLSRSPLLDRVRTAGGGRIAGVFSGARQHVPSQTVDQAFAEAKQLNADAIVSFGGGSPIDTAKAVAMRFLNDGRELIQIAIPTTLSAGEYTPFAGITDENARRKGGVGDQRLQPRTVILDPELTLETPGWLWASTGIKALDHAIEAIYSPRHQPVTDALASRAIHLLTAHLRDSMRGDADELANRVNCQLAAWMSIFGAINTRLGLSHALGHQIGARWDVPHGITSCITVPRVMRLMADVVPERFGPIADGFQVRFDIANARAAAKECASRAESFIKTLEVPTRLEQVGVKREELPQIAEAVHEEIRGSAMGDAEVSMAQLIEVLESCF